MQVSQEDYSLQRLDLGRATRGRAIAKGGGEGRESRGIPLREGTVLSVVQRSSLCDTDPFLWCRLLQVKT